MTPLPRPQGRKSSLGSGSPGPGLLDATDIDTAREPGSFGTGTLQQQNDLQRAIHARHWEERESIIVALAQGYRPVEQRAARRLAACAETSRLWLDPDRGKVTTIITRCCSPVCPFCSRARTARAKMQILAIIGRMKDPRTVILTARSNHRPLREQIAKLRDDLHKLRRSKQWRELVTGGVYTLEITWNNNTQTWHPHAHLIVDGSYFPQHLLSHLWHKATGDSFVVWIQKLKHGDTAAMELAGYIGKPAKVREMTAIALREYVGATRATRMLQTFGLCRSIPAEDADPKAAPIDPDSCITINRVRYLALKGEPNARELAKLIPIRWPIYGRFFRDLHYPESAKWYDDPPRETEVLDAAIWTHFVQLLKARTDGQLDIYDIYSVL